MIEKNIITLGDYGVGKTNIILGLTENKFNKYQIRNPGILKIKKGKEFYDLNINESNTKLIFVDTLGCEETNSLPKNYFRKVDIILLVYDISNKKSFENIYIWINLCKKTFLHDDYRYVLIGTKLDLEDKRQVTENDRKLLCSEFGINESVELSTKNKVNLNNLLYILDSNEKKFHTNENKHNSIIIYENDCKENKRNSCGGCKII